MFRPGARSGGVHSAQWDEAETTAANRRFLQRESTAPRLPPRSGGCFRAREAAVPLGRAMGAQLFLFRAGAGRFGASRESAVDAAAAKRRFSSRQAMASRFPPRSGGCLCAREAAVSH